MLHPSTKRLIDKLDEMTRKQRVSWEESDNDSVKHDTEGYRVILTAAPHSLLLTDTLGREIETCTPEDFSGETDADGRPYSEFIEDMYREAHRHARGAEKAISALLSSLDEADADEGSLVEAAPPLAEPERFEHPEDEGDESRPLEDDELPEPEYEGQAEMQAAIASMADQMSAPPAESVMAGDTELDAAPESEPEPAVEPPAMPTFSSAQAEDPEVISGPESEPYTPFAGSADTARTYAVAAEFEAPTQPEPPAAEVPEAEAEPAETVPFGGENEVWETIRSAGEPTDTPTTEPEPPAEDPTTPATRPAPVFGSSMFSDLSRYRTQEPPPAREPEPEPAPEAVAEPAPEPAQEQPAPQRSFSLSGITSGFGLGSTHSPHRAQPDNPAETVEPTERKVIDGTVDLPETLPAAKAAPADEWRMEQDSEFGFTDADMMPGIPAEPVPAAAESVPEAPTPESQENESKPDQDTEPPPRPTRRFNPWN